MLLVGAGVVLFLAVAAIREFWLSRPIGEGPAGPAVPAEPFQAAWTDRPVLLLGVGDSVTAGFGASPGLSYFERLARNPTAEFPDMQGISLGSALPNLRVLNIARSGTNSLQHVDLIRDRLPVQEADTFGLVVATTGGNDLIHWYGRSKPREGAMYGAVLAQAQPWIDNFERRLVDMLDLIDERFPGGCLVFLADIYDPTDGVGDAALAGLPSWPEGLQVHAAYQRAIQRCAERRPNVRLVPMHQEFLGHGIHCRQFWRSFYRAEDPHYWYYFNLEDPNDRGYDAIRRLFLIEIAKARDEIARPAAP